MNKFTALIVAIVGLFGSPLWALGGSGGDISLSAPPEPKPTILGVTFGSSGKDVIRSMKRQGLVLKHQDTPSRSGNSVIAFNGVPEGLSQRSGTSQFLFQHNRLVNMSILFEPSYRNFLIVRGELLASLSDRFDVEEKQEVMDSLLRARLASLDRDAFDTKAEELIKASILEGKTFFMYDVADSKEELAISLSYTNDHSGGGEPLLMLTYEYLKPIEVGGEKLGGERAGGGLLPRE